MFDFLKEKLKKLSKIFSEKRVKLGTKIKAAVSKKVKLSKEEIERFLEEIEFDLLEADISLSSLEILKEKIKEKAAEREFSVENAEKEMREIVKEVLVEIFPGSFNIFEKIKEYSKPVKILVVGLNGVGKTSFIGKLSFLLKRQNYSVVIAASDTFRAGAIEQIEEIARKVKVKVVKRDYGSDPASVAFDAVEYAKARKIDVVIVDVAGRQNTNKSLMEELKKIKRVIKPDITLYVIESYAGKGSLHQLRDFLSEVGVDALVITKLDVDPKGGNIINIFLELKIPVAFVCVGQNFEDIELFDQEKFVSMLVER